MGVFFYGFRKNKYKKEKWKMDKAYVYIVKCSDKSFYTGYTNDLRARMVKHNQGLGAKYTRGRRPVTLVYFEELPDKSQALSREAAIKKMKRGQKLKLIERADQKEDIAKIIEKAWTLDKIDKHLML